jgi:hypothetical protein
VTLRARWVTLRARWGAFHRDKDGVFAGAVARDARSYRDDVFVEAARLLRQVGGVDESGIVSFEGLADAVRRVPTPGPQGVVAERGSTPPARGVPLRGHLPSISPAVSGRSTLLRRRETRRRVRRRTTSCWAKYPTTSRTRSSAR